MFNKLSNTATKEHIEHKFNAAFEYPNLYAPQAVIDGSEEAILPVLTTQDRNKINFAIWGLLPSAYEDSWQVFQSVYNTLDVDVKVLGAKRGVFADTLEKRRCAIIVNGFFGPYLSHGSIDYGFLHLPSNEPFALAGVYNELEDGFLTVSLVLTAQPKGKFWIDFLSDNQPLILNGKSLEHWLDPGFKFNTHEWLLSDDQNLSFICDYGFDKHNRSTLRIVTD